jgi:hypothetical protein
MKHFATPGFWYCYRQLPREIQELADKNFRLVAPTSAAPIVAIKEDWRVLFGARRIALSSFGAST